MIRIVCESSPITMLPVRALLNLVHLHPKDYRQLAGYALLYPFSGRYRKALNNMSYVERVPEAQFLGVTTQWRARRWLTWLARAIAPLLHKKRVFFYKAENLDEPTRLFFRILQPHVAQGTINFMFGAPSYEGAYSANLTQDLLPEERPLLALLRKDKLTPSEMETLQEAGIGCILSTNLWQAHRVFEALRDYNLSRSLFVSGLVHRFYEQLPAAEWYFERALATNDAVKDPVEHIQIRYAITVLHLRFHPKEVRDSALAWQHLNQSYRLIESEHLPQETQVYTRTMLDALRALAEFRDGDFEKALETCNITIARLETLPESPRRGCCLVYSLGNRAQVLRSLGRLEEAAEDDRRATEIDPQLPFWWVEYAKCLFELERFSELHAVLERALDLHFDSADLHALQGRYFMQMGQHAFSAQAYERALRYQPNEKTYFREMGAARERQQERQNEYRKPETMQSA